MLIAQWIVMGLGSIAISLTAIVRIKRRLGSAKDAAIRTYDQRRMMGGSKDDATAAAFMAQAYHLCTAFDFLCCPCWILGMCRDPAVTRYRKFDEEAASAIAC